MTDARLPSVVEKALETGIEILESDGTSLGALVKDVGLTHVPGIGGTIAAIALKAYQRHVAQKVERWFGLVSDLMELGSPEAAAEHINEHIDEGWAHQGVVEGVRAVLNDIDDVALPALAKLVATRLKSKKPPNPRDRRAIRMLCECDAPTYKAIVLTVANAKRHLSNGGSVEIHLKSNNTAEVHLPGGMAKLSEFSLDGSMSRAFHLLKQHQFGRDNPTGFADLIGGPNVLVIHNDSVEYLVKYLL